MIFDFFISDPSTQEMSSGTDQITATEHTPSVIVPCSLDLCNTIIEPQNYQMPSIGLSDMDDGQLLQPYDHSQTTNLIYRATNPIGQYVASNTDYGLNGVPNPELMHQLTVPDNFSVSDIQQVCNAICDTMHWPHIPTHITTDTPNAAFNPGLFTHRTFDDNLFLNPNYAHQSVVETGSTEIIIADMAHEIGHSMAFKLCGDCGTFLNEKLADMISGYVCGKMGVDIDVARRWFEKHYDSEGYGGYPVTDERWEAQMAGYYLSHITNAEDLQSALKDQRFVDIIAAYHHDSGEFAKNMGYTNVEEAVSNNSDFFSQLLGSLHNFSSRYHLPQLAARLARNIRF